MMLNRCLLFIVLSASLLVFSGCGDDNTTSTAATKQIITDLKAWHLMNAEYLQKVGVAETAVDGPQTLQASGLIGKQEKRPGNPSGLFSCLGQIADKNAGKVWAGGITGGSTALSGTPASSGDKRCPGPAATTQPRP